MMPPLQPCFTIACVQVNNDLLWEDIQEEFKVPVACTNGSQALKYIYFRFVEFLVYDRCC